MNIGMHVLKNPGILEKPLEQIIRKSKSNQIFRNNAIESVTRGGRYK